MKCVTWIQDLSAATAISGCVCSIKRSGVEVASLPATRISIFGSSRIGSAMHGLMVKNWSATTATKFKSNGWRVELLKGETNKEWECVCK